MLLHLVWRMEKYYVTSKLSATPVGSQVIHVPERMLKNNTDDCGKVHGVTFLESQACLVLLAFLQRL